MTEIHFLTLSMRSLPTVFESVNGLYPPCAGQLHSLEYGTEKI